MSPRLESGKPENAAMALLNKGFGVAAENETNKETQIDKEMKKLMVLTQEEVKQSYGKKKEVVIYKNKIHFSY